MNISQFTFKVVSLVILVSTSVFGVEVENMFGKMTVNQGSISYELPLKLSPGINNRTPQIGLAYSSMASNGYLGQGWNISGLSAISRCPSTMVQDGKVAGIKNDSSDNYCLDGQRLIPINGLNGKSGTEYRTEINTFSKIISYEEQEKGPKKFKVWTKAGEILEYGFSDDARVELSNNTTVHTWKVNKRSDNFNNAYVYHYLENSIIGENYISQIEYANGKNKIDFIYENRKDELSAYKTGSINTISKRLSKINLVTDGIYTRTYSLNYDEENNAYDVSKLISINYCIGEECINPVVFNWYENQSAFFAASNQGIDTIISSDLGQAYQDKARIKFVDLNNDGLTDIYYVNGSGSSEYDTLYVNQGNGTFITKQTINTFISANNEEAILDVGRIQFQDMNGDGKTDIYYIKGLGSSAPDDIYLNDGNSNFSRIDGPNTYISTDIGDALLDISRIKFADFNGDGLKDIYYIQDGYDKLYLNKNNGIFTEVQGVNSQISSDPSITSVDVSRLKFIDLNGDGRTDIYYINGSGTSAQDTIYFSDGNGNFSPIQTISTFVSSDVNIASIDISRIKFGDFNGDGLRDIYRVNGWGTSEYDTIYINKGNGVFISKNALKTFIDSDSTKAKVDIQRINIINFNDDKRSDVYYVNGFGTEEVDTIYINNSDGTFSTINGIKTKISAEPGVTCFDISRLVFRDFNGDGFTDIYYLKGWGNTEVDELYFNQENKLLLRDVKDSFSQGFTVTYRPMTDKTVYTKINDGVYPNIDFQNSMPLVSSIRQSNGIGGETTENYKYTGYKLNTLGRGPLGFNTVTVTNLESGQRLVNNFNQHFPLAGSAKESTQFSFDGSMLAQTKIEYIHTKMMFNNKSIHSVKMDLFDNRKYYKGSLLGKELKKYIEYDDFNNILKLERKIKNNYDESSQIFTNEYKNDIAKWHIGKMINQKIVHSNTNNAESITQNYSYSFDASTGALTEEHNATGTLLENVKTHVYDQYGNVVLQTLSSSDSEPRTTQFEFDENGRFLIKKINSQGHMTMAKHEPVYGHPLVYTDENGVETHSTYNVFGKALNERKEDGSYIEYVVSFDNSLIGSIYKVATHKNSGEYKEHYYDALQRELRVVKQVFDGRMVLVDYKYDSSGNKIEESLPYYEGDTKVWKKFFYDEHNRHTKVDTFMANGEEAQANFTYSGNSVTGEISNGTQKVINLNVSGKATSITEHSAGVKTEYDALGNILHTIDSNGNTISYKYDVNNNTIYMNDPDLGEWHYKYNAFSELIWQKDPNGNVTRVEYDQLGRMVKRYEKEGSSTWQYDVGEHAVGKLVYETNEYGKNKQYKYDEFSRIIGEVIDIDGYIYNTTYEYDQYGRQLRITHPNGYVVENVYNEFGFLEAVKSPKKTLDGLDVDYLKSLISSALEDTLIQHDKSLTLSKKANRIRNKIQAYEKLRHTLKKQKRDELDETVLRLETIALSLEIASKSHQQNSEKHKSQASYYVTKADEYKHAWKQAEKEAYIQWLYSRYESFAATYAQKIQDYLSDARNPDFNGEVIVSSYAQKSKEYLDVLREHRQIVRQYNNLLNFTSNKNLPYGYVKLLEDDNYNYLYKVLERDQFERIVKYVAGNGLITHQTFTETGALTQITTGYDGDSSIRDLNYEYDNKNNVVFRRDAQLDINQVFEYDEYNRLSTSNTSGNAFLISMQYQYDTLGNMLYKSDIGNYKYDVLHPHAVVQAGNKVFKYDSNGNMINNNGTHIEYASFNKPTHISATNKNHTRGYISKDGHHLKKNVNNFTTDFYYDANHVRYKKVTRFATTHYISKNFERVLNNNSSEFKNFIYADGKLVAMHIDKLKQNGWLIPYTRFLHYDSLNSVDTITSGQGAVVQRAIYKPFGEQIFLDSENNLLSDKEAFTTRGYTGHEHISGTNLIHMNGRVYDASIARFLSPDPYIQDVQDPQSYNRYSYVKNNPMKYTDPSGYWSWNDIFVAIAIVVVVIVILAILTPVSVLAYLGAAAIGAAVGAGISALIWIAFNGGIPTDAAQLDELMRDMAVGAVLGALTGAIGTFWAPDISLANGFFGKSAAVQWHNITRSLAQVGTKILSVGLVLELSDGNSFLSPQDWGSTILGGIGGDFGGSGWMYFTS